MTKLFLIRVLAGIATLVIISSGAFAQDAPANRSLKDGAQVLQGKWAKVCDPESQANRLCMTTIDSFVKIKGVEKPVWLASAAVRAIEDEAKTKTLLFRVPLQVRLKEGVLLRIDDGKVARVSYTFCQEIGCWVTIPANDNTIAQLKQGNKAVLQFTDMRNNTHQVEITLAGFTKAFDGPPAKVLAVPSGQIALPAAKNSEKGDAPAQ